MVSDGDLFFFHTDAWRFTTIELVHLYYTCITYVLHLYYTCITPVEKKISYA